MKPITATSVLFFLAGSVSALDTSSIVDRIPKPMIHPPSQPPDGHRSTPNAFVAWRHSIRSPFERDLGVMISTALVLNKDEAAKILAESHCCSGQEDIALAVLYKSTKGLYENEPCPDTDPMPHFIGSKADYSEVEGKVHVTAKLFFHPNVTTAQLQHGAEAVERQWSFNTTVLADFEPGPGKFGDAGPKMCNRNGKRARQITRRAETERKWINCDFCEKDNGDWADVGKAADLKTHIFYSSKETPYCLPWTCDES